MTDIAYALDLGESYAIGTDVEAEQALRRVLDNNAERDRLVQLALNMASQYKAKADAIVKEFERKNERDTIALKTYFAGVEKHTTKTMQSYRLMSGRLVMKAKQPEYKRDEAALLAWAKDNAPEFVLERTTQYLDWAWLKKEVTFNEGQAYYNETGEAIPGVEVIDRGDEFIIEGGKNG